MVECTIKTWRKFRAWQNISGARVPQWVLDRLGDYPKNTKWISEGDWLIECINDVSDHDASFLQLNNEEFHRNFTLASDFDEHMMRQDFDELEHRYCDEIMVAERTYNDTEGNLTRAILSALICNETNAKR